MNRKDIVSLMEAYEDVVLDNQVEDEPEMEAGGGNGYPEGPSISIGGESEMPEHTHDESDLEDMEEQKTKMVEAHLHTIRSHAHEIFSVIENGALIEPWMEEKIAIANDYIVHVANAIMYKK
jgi:hypothetical protein